MQVQPTSTTPSHLDVRRHEQAASIPDDVFRGGVLARAKRRLALTHPWMLALGRPNRREGRAGR